MANFIPFIIYRDDQGRIYTTNLFPIPFPVKGLTHKFLLNYEEAKNKKFSFIYSYHFSIVEVIEESHFDKYYSGIIREILDMDNKVLYPTAYGRPFLKVIYDTREFGGFHLN